MDVLEESGLILSRPQGLWCWFERERFMAGFHEYTELLVVHAIEKEVGVKKGQVHVVEGFAGLNGTGNPWVYIEVPKEANYRRLTEISSIAGFPLAGVEIAGEVAPIS